jgi:hypothetical protein
MVRGCPLKFLALGCGWPESGPFRHHKRRQQQQIQTGKNPEQASRRKRRRARHHLRRMPTAVTISSPARRPAATRVFRHPSRIYTNPIRRELTPGRRRPPFSPRAGDRPGRPLGCGILREARERVITMPVTDDQVATLRALSPRPWSAGSAPATSPLTSWRSSPASGPALTAWPRNSTPTWPSGSSASCSKTPRRRPEPERVTGAQVLLLIGLTADAQLDGQGWTSSWPAPGSSPTS